MDPTLHWPSGIAGGGDRMRYLWSRDRLMRSARHLTVWLTALGVAVTPIAPRAEDATAPSSGPVPAAPAAPAAPAGPATMLPAPPADAAMALARARAAYEYGDMEIVVESARLVAEGRLHPSPNDRAQALRYLGIGLFLTSRPEGAETAFFELLRLRPATRLDATTTRPDCVAFFEDVRRRHADEIRRAARSHPGKSFVLALLPPLGQFQDGHRARGITIGALEALSLGTAIATKLQLRAWSGPDQTFMGHVEAARTLRTVNVLSVAVLVLTVVLGIVDGVTNYGADDEDSGAGTLADVWGPGLRF
jgi:hypothetical protein